MSLAPTSLSRAARIAVPLLLLALAAYLGPGCIPSTQRSSMRLGMLEVITLRREYMNAHLVRQGENAFLIDTGLRENAAALADDIAREGVDPRSLRAIVLTHGHADHAGGAHYFQEHFGVRVIAGSGDEAMLARGANDRLCPTGDSSRLAQDQAAEYDPTQADTLVQDTLDLAPIVGIDAQVTRLAGHTEGSLVVTAGDAVFVGDLFRGSVFGSDADRHFYMCDVPDNDADIRTLVDQIAPHATTFFVGHFGPIARDRVIARFVP